MNDTPSLQELQRAGGKMQLTRLQLLGLRIAAGLQPGHIASKSLWQSLIDLRLIDREHQLTFLGKQQILEHFGKKIKQKK